MFSISFALPLKYSVIIVIIIFSCVQWSCKNSNEPTKPTGSYFTIEKIPITHNEAPTGKSFILSVL